MNECYFEWAQLPGASLESESWSNQEFPAVPEFFPAHSGVLVLPYASSQEQHLP